MLLTSRGIPRIEAGSKEFIAAAGIVIVVLAVALIISYAMKKRKKG